MPICYLQIIKSLSIFLALLFQCDATWSSEIYDTFKGYKDGKTKSISTGYGIEFGPSVNADVNAPGTFEYFKPY